MAVIKEMAFQVLEKEPPVRKIGVSGSEKY